MADQPGDTLNIWKEIKGFVGSHVPNLNGALVNGIEGAAAGAAVGMLLGGDHPVIGALVGAGLGAFFKDGIVGFMDNHNKTALGLGLLTAGLAKAFGKKGWEAVGMGAVVTLLATIATDVVKGGAGQTASHSGLGNNDPLPVF